MRCISQCVSPKLRRTFLSKTDSECNSPALHDIRRDSVSLLGRENDIKRESTRIVEQKVPVAKDSNDPAFCKIATKHKPHDLAEAIKPNDSICFTRLSLSPYVDIPIARTKTSTLQGQASYPRGQSGTEVGQSDTDSTQSEREQLRTSLTAVRNELEQTRKKYLTEKAQSEHKEKNLVNLALQFTVLLKSLHQKNKEVEALLGDTKSLRAEKDRLQHKPGEAASGSCQASTEQYDKDKYTQQEIKAEVDALRREVESHHAEMANILHERAIETERKDNEVRKLKSELVSLKFDVLENQLASTRDISRERNGATKIEEFFDQGGAFENRITEVENGGTEGKIPLQRQTLAPLLTKERRIKKEIGKSVAERGRKRTESPWVKIKSEWEIIVPSDCHRTTLRKTYRGNFNKRKHRYHISPRGGMESIPEQRSQGGESVSEFYERLHRTQTESMLARKRSHEGGVSAKGSDREPTKPHLKNPAQSSTNDPIKISKSPLTSSGKGQESAFPAFPSSPHSVAEMTPFYRSSS